MFLQEEYQDILRMVVSKKVEEDLSKNHSRNAYLG